MNSNALGHHNDHIPLFLSVFEKEGNALEYSSKPQGTLSTDRVL